MLEVVPALFWCVKITDRSDGLPESVDGSCACLAQMGLEFGEGHFDGIEIGAVGREEEEPGAACFEDGLGLFAFVGWQIVEDDHVAWPQCRGELGLDIGLEDLAVHRTIDHPGRSQAIVAQGGDEGLCAPMAERRLHLQPFATPRPPAQPGHLGSRAGFIDEHQPLGPLDHPRLTVCVPNPPCPDNVSAIGFARQQRFF